MQRTPRIYPWYTVIFNTRKWLHQCLQSVKHYNVCRHKLPFSTVNREFQNINEWFISNKQWFILNKLSFNVKKSNFSIFHKASSRDDLPVLLPKLFINNQVIKRESSIKFLVSYWMKTCHGRNIWNWQKIRLLRI